MSWESYLDLTFTEREVLHDRLNEYIEEENRRIEKASQKG